ncbi:MAG: LysE family transporter [Flammeovirgaceae bacterium]|nr:LysE family transporter [Flammeovirgaceae bacterium]
MVLQVFIIGAFFSFIGSIPPGTLNILVFQLGLEQKVKIALRFAVAVAIIEYPYTWIAVEFEDLITSSPVVLENFQLLAAIVMTTLGIFSLWTAKKPSAFSVKLQQSGFRRGLILSILNPQAIPFWIGVTAYLKSQGWIDLTTSWRLHSYVFGTSVGVFALLLLLAVMAQKVSGLFQRNRIVSLLPGTILLALGLFAFYQFFSS